MSEASPPNDGGVSASEREELQRLRARVAELERAAAGRVGTRWGRAVASAALITVGCLLASVSLVAIWSDNVVSSTDRYVAHVAPLASMPSVQDAVATRATGVIVEQIDVEGVVAQTVATLEERGLPPRTAARLHGLVGPLDGAVEGFVHENALRVVRSDRFAALWEQANRAAHSEVNALLSGEGGRALDVRGDTVTLDLGPILESVKDRLEADGLTIVASLPEVHPTFDLFRAEGLARAQMAYSLLNTLAWLLPLASVLMLAAGVALAARRRRAVLGAALGLAAAMLLLALALVVGRVMFLNLVAAEGADAARDVYDALVRSLRDWLVAVLVAAAAAAVAAYVAGPGAGATRIRASARKAGSRIARWTSRPPSAPASAQGDA